MSEKKAIASRRPVSGRTARPRGRAVHRRGFWTRRSRFRRIRAALAKIGYGITPSCLFSSCQCCGRHQAGYCLEIYAKKRAGGASTF